MIVFKSSSLLLLTSGGSLYCALVLSLYIILPYAAVLYGVYLFIDKHWQIHILSISFISQELNFDEKIKL